MGMFLGSMHFKANGKMFTGRTYGTGNVGILTPDIEYSGMVGTIKLGETVVAGDLVTPVSADQEFKLADPTASAIVGPATAIMLEGGANGGYALALFEGYMKYNSWLTTEYLCAKARAELTVDDVTVDAETVTINAAAVLGNDVSDDGVVAGSNFLVVPASTSLANFKTVTSKTLINAALAALTTDPMARVETTWAGDVLAFVAVNAGTAANDFADADTFTNGSWTTSWAGGTNAGVVYCGDSGKPACAANIPATSNDMVQVVGQAISPTEIMFKPITDYDLSA